MAYIGTDIGSDARTEVVLLTEGNDMRSASKCDHSAIVAHDFIDTDFFIGGHVRLDADTACEAVRRYVVYAHDMSVQQFAAQSSAASVVAQQVLCIHRASDHIDIDVFDKGHERSRVRANDVVLKRYYGKNTAQRAKRVECTAANASRTQVTNVAGSNVQIAHT